MVNENDFVVGKVYSFYEALGIRFIYLGRRDEPDMDYRTFAIYEPDKDCISWLGRQHLRMVNDTHTYACPSLFLIAKIRAAELLQHLPDFQVR